MVITPTESNPSRLMNFQRKGIDAEVLFLKILNCQVMCDVILIINVQEMRRQTRVILEVIIIKVDDERLSPLQNVWLQPTRLLRMLAMV